MDVLVEFKGPTTFDGYFDLKFYLERLLGRPVDLATQNMIRQEIRKNVERDLVHVS